MQRNTCLDNTIMISAVSCVTIWTLPNTVLAKIAWQMKWNDFKIQIQIHSVIMIWYPQFEIHETCDMIWAIIIFFKEVCTSWLIYTLFELKTGHDPRNLARQKLHELGSVWAIPPKRLQIENSLTCLNSFTLRSWPIFCLRVGFNRGFFRRCTVNLPSSIPT